MQSLGTRLRKAANSEELLHRVKAQGSKRDPKQEAEIRSIIEDVKKLLVQIDDAVPLINLAITTSGVSLSTSLPPTVSPSRLLQASSLVSAGDQIFSITPNSPAQVGPAFVLSIYMLFAGHNRQSLDKGHDMRNTSWKEVIHKARVRLLRTTRAISQSPIGSDTCSIGNNSLQPENIRSTVEGKDEAYLPSEGQVSEFNYMLEIIEDFDDGRVHTFEEGQSQPEPYQDIDLAGIREFIPIHQVSKIFYADTGKLLNIGTESEINSPILLLKRDVNAPHPRQMMAKSEQRHAWDEEEFGAEEEESDTTDATFDDDSQADIDHQLHSESSMLMSTEEMTADTPRPISSWCFPTDLDAEWLAFEVYTDIQGDSSDEDEDTADDSTYVSEHPSFSKKSSSFDDSFNTGLKNLRLDSSTPESRMAAANHKFLDATPMQTPSFPPSSSPIHESTNMLASQWGPVRSSLSLLEMLIRLTSLQNHQQKSHLTISDELLNFFLVESSASGAGQDGEQRRMLYHEAKQKIGFNPYYDTPMKPRGHGNSYSDEDARPNSGQYRGATPNADYDERSPYYNEESNQEWPRERSGTPSRTPDQWLLRSSDIPSSPRLPTSSVPVTPYVPKRAKRPIDRVQQVRSKPTVGSPLGRGKSVETDSTLGTSPGTPSFEDRKA
jgi:hypothetical protein